MKLKTDPSKIKKVMVWGNHSALAYPDVTQATFSGKPVEEVRVSHKK